MYAEIRSFPNPQNATRLKGLRLFAIVGSWMEADIIGATVQNAMTQGCERVYLVDNNSPDETVTNAEKSGAILARSFNSERYQESVRLNHMNDVVREVSEQEPDQYIWWLFLDADEFPHGPLGLTVWDYLTTLDEKIRVVGGRFFDHYPHEKPAYISGRHPLDFQPLCEECSLPMCASGHRKHSLLRHDKDSPRLLAGNGFHLVSGDSTVYEPMTPIFLHHFPFREEEGTRKRLQLLWRKDGRGESRADPTVDTHMLARVRSLDAVYQQKWADVVNFVALDPIRDSLSFPPKNSGVSLNKWEDLIEPVHRPVMRWYPMMGAWNYASLSEFSYGDDISYRKGMSFLDGHGTIEDWGCGFTHAKRFVEKSRYVGIDGSSPRADKRVDLKDYVSDTDCIFMRHVLEHNANWRDILQNAINSFRKRMVLIIFTPFQEITRQIASSTAVTRFPVPDIAFNKQDITRFFGDIKYDEESVTSNTQYEQEHIFYLEKTKKFKAVSSDDPRAIVEPLVPQRNYQDLKIVSFGPNPVVHGVPFNPQPGGESAIWVKLSGHAERGFSLVLNNHHLKTTVRDELLTAIVPEALLAAPGTLPLYVELPVNRGPTLATPSVEFIVE